MRGDDARVRPNGERPSRSRIWVFRALAIGATIIVLALAWIGLELGPAQPAAIDPTLAAFSTLLASSSVTASLPATETSPAESHTPQPTHVSATGTLIFGARVGGRSHIWAFSAGDPTPIALTAGPWDDRDPALSPDGTSLAFASRRNGFWDLYVLNLQSGELRQLTDTKDYEGHPTWSPDGQWVAFEAYYDGDFDIWIAPMDSTQGVIQLTNHPASDTAPAWDRGGRRIAFVSDREGEADIFLASLDLLDPLTGEPILAENRFRNLTQTADVIEGFPVFSAGGDQLAYSVHNDGIDQIFWFDLGSADLNPQPVGQGRSPAWSPDGELLAAILEGSQGNHLVGYTVSATADRTIGFPITHRVDGLDWGEHGLPGETYTRAAGFPSEPTLFVPSINEDPFGRITIVPLPRVSAPDPKLSDAVDEAFIALRERILRETGWDFLLNLENAFVGINDPLTPGRPNDDWLYTGRAFAIDPSILQAGWVEIIREDIQGSTYWRVFVRAAVQDGSLGQPLREYPWDLDARFNGQPQSYDEGGARKTRIPDGYYVDFTTLARDYGFERSPALPNWRSYYQGAYYNQFAFRGGLAWEQAMLQIYPASALITPTPFMTPTRTPTKTVRPTNTPWWYRTPTASPTFTPPTSTPSPTGT
jgi:TolB protein